MSSAKQRRIWIYADWAGLPGPTLMGALSSSTVRGRESFAFEYDPAWLAGAHRFDLDPQLSFYGGPQYAPEDRPNFGLFLDSSPDRWGRMIMDRREAREARLEQRNAHLLLESDYLLGVHDAQRLGALRFRTNPAGPFLDQRSEEAAPPLAALHELEAAAMGIDRGDAIHNRAYDKWLRLLIAPGASLGGARPKAGVIDPQGGLWIAKFPSTRDTGDSGAWEMVVHELARAAGIDVAESRAQRFAARHHTFITRRFDRTATRARIHFASAMTLLGHSDGDDAQAGASYAEIASILIAGGAQTNRDLAQLWRRIVFFICVSNTDDHLRNHGFLLVPGKGWRLAPAYDMNPVSAGEGLRLNIVGNENELNLDLAREAAALYRVPKPTREAIIAGVRKAVRRWPQLAQKYRISRAEQERMARAFRLTAVS